MIETCLIVFGVFAALSGVIAEAGRRSGVVK